MESGMEAQELLNLMPHSNGFRLYDGRQEPEK
jgi:hypothetical protein